MPSTDAQIRKYKRSMVLCGQGMLFFIVWAVIKSTIIFTLDSSDTTSLESDLSNATTVDNAFLIRVLLIFFVTIIMTLTMFISQIKAGVGSIKYGRGKSTKTKFLRSAAIFGLLTLLTIPSYFLSQSAINDIFFAGRSEEFLIEISTNQDTLDIRVASLLVDLTQLFTIFDMFRSHHKIKVLEKQV